MDLPEKNQMNKIVRRFRNDFKWQYWLLIFALVIILSLHIIARSAHSPYRFLIYIQDFLPEAIAAAVSAVITNYINDFNNKSLKMVPHVIYPLIAGTVLFLAILSFSDVFSTVEIVISGMGDGQFTENEIQRINDELGENNKNVKLSLGMNYCRIAGQAGNGCPPVNVNKVYSALTAQIESGENKSDIYELDVIWIPYFVKKGWIIPLDQYRNKSKIRYTFGVEQETGRFVYKKDGSTPYKQTFVVPSFLNVGFLMYRVDLFHRLIGKDREPSSWDELIEWLYEVKEKYGDEYDGFVFQGARYEGLMCNYMEILWANGGEIVEENGIPRVDTPEGVRALEFFARLLRDGIIPREVLTYNEAKSLEHFARGKTLVLRHWPRAFYNIQHYRKYRHLRNKVNIMSKPLPFRGVARASAKMSLGGWSYAVSRHAYDSGRAKAAMEVIEYLTSEKQFNESMYPQFPGQEGTSLRIPAHKLVIENAKGEKDTLDYAYTYLKNRYYRTRPKFPYYAVFSEILVRHIHQYLKDGKPTAEETLRNAQEELNRTIPGLEISMNSP